MNKFRFFLSALICMLSLSSAWAFDYTDSNGVTWTCDTYTTNGVTEAYIRGVSNYSAHKDDLIVPETVTNGSTTYTVTSVGHPTTSYTGSFYNKTDITSVTIPTTVRTIGYESFRGCSGLTSIVIPNSVTRIGDSSFYGCSGLTSVEIPNSVTSIGYESFRDCSGLTSVEIGNSVTSIGNYTFQKCSGLTSIVIPNSVTSIGVYAFSGCSGLTSVVIPNSVTSIGQSAFSNCSKIDEIYITDVAAWCKISGLSNLTNQGASSKTLYINNVEASDIVIPSDANVETIPSSAFRYFTNITSVEIPNSVTSIGSDAFNNCSNIGKIYITDVAAWCKISGLSNLTDRGASSKTLYINNVEASNVVIPSDANVETIPYGAFQYFTNITSVTIPNSVTSIGGSAFYGCSGLTSVSIGNSVTTIGNYAFRDCSKIDKICITDVAAWCKISGLSTLTDYGASSKTLYINNVEASNVVIPSDANVETIPSSAFRYFTNITSIEIPNSVTSIGTQAFYYCSGLTSVVIPNSVTSIGQSAFSNCSKIDEIYITDVAAWCKISGLSNLTNQGASSKTLYINNVEASDIVIPSDANVETIPSSAFRYFKNITSVSIGNSVTSIGDYAFRGCSGLTSVEIPNSVTSIGQYAFSGCSGLTKMELPFVGRSADALESSGFLGSIFDSTASEGMVQINQYYFTGTISKVSSYFYLPEGLKEIKINGGNIHRGAFSNCTMLEKITLPSTSFAIEKEAFSGCSNLALLGDMAACTSIGEQAFQGCTSLASIGDLSACTSIGNSAFSYCSALTSIGDLSACTSIGSRVFTNCYKLEPITISNNEVATLGGVMPDYLTVMVPADLVDKYRAAAGWNEMPYRVIPIGTQTIYDNVAVTMPATGSGIQNAIGEKNLGNVLELKVTGDINAYDIFIIRNNMPNLHKLDLSDANVKAVTDGSAYKYYNNYTTSDDVLGDFAFYQQTKLLDVKLPKSIKSIGNYTFDGCASLQSADFYEGLETIGVYAFAACGQLNDVSIKEGIKTIGYSAFSSCSKLSNITIADGLEMIDSYAFSNSGLKEIIVPEGVTVINGYAFSSCSNLAKVTLPSTLQSIGQYCFNGCSNLKDINLPSNLTTISSCAFQSCSSLEEITLPTKLTSIGGSAFAGCTKLNTVRVTALDSHSVTISDNTFASYNTATLYIPKDEETGWDATYQSYYWNTQWGQFYMKDTWTPTYDDVLINGDYDQENGTIPGEDINAEIGNNGGYIVGGNADQDFNDVEIDSDATNGQGGSIIVENGGNLNVNTLTQQVNVAANKWYFFCFPFDVMVADIEVKGQYVLYKYDGEQRANEKSGWVKLTADDTTLLAGQGYIFQTNTACKIKVPATNPQFNSDDKMTVLQVYPANNKNDASWNLVGNPYLAYYNLEDLGYTAPITYWNGTSYVAARPGDDDYAVQPLQAFFVQTTVDENGNKNDIEFPVEGCETYLQSKNTTGQAKAARAQSKINPERLILNLVISDGENEDKTRVVFNDKQQMEYEPECDAAKFMSSEDVPQLYSVYNNVQYAINERPVMNGDVQLGFKATKAGTYSIAMHRMDTPMLLKDNELGVTFDFANGEYTFDAQAGSNEHRFTLLMNGDPTAVKPVTVGDAESATYFNTAGQRTNASSKGIVIEKAGNSVKKVLNK